MSMALTRSPEYLRDIVGILQYFIDKNTPASALKFGKRVETTLELLALFPEMGSPWASKNTALHGVRFQKWDELSYPGSRGDNQAVRLIMSAFRRDHHAIAGRLPAQHTLVSPHAGAGSLREGNVL